MSWLVGVRALNCISSGASSTRSCIFPSSEGTLKSGIWQQCITKCILTYFLGVRSSTLVGAMCSESTLSKRYRASIEKDTSHKPPDRPSATHHAFVRKADDEKPSLERNRQFLPSSVDSVIIRRCSKLFRHSHTAIGQFFRNRMWSKIANQTRNAISTAPSFNGGILNYLLGFFRTRALLPQCTYADYSIASSPLKQEPVLSRSCRTIVK